MVFRLFCHKMKCTSIEMHEVQNETNLQQNMLLFGCANVLSVQILVLKKNNLHYSFI